MEDRAIKIVEGTCPDCDADTNIVRIGGTEEFHRDITFYAPDAVLDVWERGVTEFGMIEVRCASGHVNTAYLTFGHDWVA